MRLKDLATFLAALAFSSGALADNLTRASAHWYLVGGAPAEAFLSSTATERWYQFMVHPGRSYCVETQGGVHFDTSSTAGNIATRVEVYNSNVPPGLVVGGNDSGFEPYAGALSRGCWIASAVETLYVVVKRASETGQFNFRVRIVESTLYSNWFFTGGDYGAYTLVRNTTSSWVSYVITWRNASGVVVATVSGVLVANGNTYVNAAELPGALAAQTGSVEIAFESSPSALVASTTVLSSTTGLSFDAPFSQRPTW